VHCTMGGIGAHSSHNVRHANIAPLYVALHNQVI